MYCYEFGVFTQERIWDQESLATSVRNGAHIWVFSGKRNTPDLLKHPVIQALIY